MLLKEVKDHKDNMTWRCHKVHHVKNEGKNYTVKRSESVHQRKQLDIGCTTLPRTDNLIYLFVDTQDDKC